MMWSWDFFAVNKVGIGKSCDSKVVKEWQKSH